MNKVLEGVLKNFDVEYAVEGIIDWLRDYFCDGKTKAVIGVSGGKDSTIALKLLVDAIGPERVIAVKLPMISNEPDIHYANKAIEFTKIPNKNIIQIPTDSICGHMYDDLEEIADCKISNRIITNLPARVRMTLLYAIAADCHGRVVNTCNYSENYVGYATKFGDAAGDFGIFRQFCVTEILEIGEYLDIPEELVHKPPSDGMCGKTDEDNLGFTYEALDTYLLSGCKEGSKEFIDMVETKFNQNKHKHFSMPHPYNLGYQVFSVPQLEKT